MSKVPKMTNQREEVLLTSVLNMVNKTLADPMILFTNRLATFTDWGFKSGSCTAEHMADAGFFVVNDDLVKCMFCLKELDNWEATDDPWAEHKSHKPDCAFIKLDKRTIRSWTIEELLEMNHVVRRNKMVQELEQQKDYFRKGSLYHEVDNLRTDALQKAKSIFKK